MVFLQFVQEYILSVFLTALVLSVCYLTWKLSCRLPLNYHVHLIQTYHLESQQVVEVVNIDPERVQTEELVGLITEEREFANSDRRHSPQVRALVVHSPSFIRPVELQSESFAVPGTTLIYLPSNLERHVSQIYQSLQTYSDPAVAGAVVISLYRHVARRLSNQHNLYISQLLSEVGTTDSNFTSDLSSLSDPEELGASVATSSGHNSASNSSSVDGNPTITNDERIASNEHPREEEENTATNNFSNSEMSNDVNTNGPNIKLKFLDDTERVVKTNLAATVSDFKKVNFSEQVAGGKIIRLIFKGQLLRDDNRSLESYGLYENCIVHCHISSRPYAQPTTRSSSNGDGVNAGHDRPNYNDVQIPVRPVFDEVNNEPWVMRILRLGVYYADMIPFVLFYALTSCTSWIREIENVPTDEGLPWHERQVNRLRRGMFAVLSVFVDFSTQQNDNPEDLFANRFNIGVLFTLLFTVKVLSIWCVVIYFPAYVDVKAFSMLLILTIFFGIYTLNNHPRMNRGLEDGPVVQ